MKKLIILTALLLLTICVKSQITDNTFQALEVTFSNEDKAPGFNAYLFNKGFGLVAGFETGNYRFGDTAKTEHDKYRLGLAINATEKDSYYCGGSLIFYATACYNEYKEVYDKFDHINDDLPTYTCELGVKFLFPNSRVFSGFQYDIIHKTGGFSVGLIINK
jgi:hypothetical protein